MDRRFLAAAIGGTLLAGALTACGSGAAGAPEDASEKDFCGAFADIYEASGAIEGGEPTEEEFDAIIDKVAELGEVGTPKGISADERAGFEVYIDEVTDLDYDEVMDSGVNDDLFDVSAGEDENIREFLAYGTETCAEQLPATVTP